VAKEASSEPAVTASSTTTARSVHAAGEVTRVRAATGSSLPR
jgi:hypothetical protein